uniref:RAMP superfamily CRISPR-associated protein n=1 Tax=Succinivibrio sp. TaxID=2053619 RepID=UPI00402B0185
MIVSRFIIKLKTPLHCGGGNSLFLDGPVSRDPFGYWNIQGSSLAGVLRASLREIDKDLADSLFGFIKEVIYKVTLFCYGDETLYK